MRIPAAARAALLGAVALVAASLLAPPAGAASTDSAGPAAQAERPADPVAHDPTMVKEGDWYYVVITGDAGTHTYLPVKRSKDLVHWTELGPVFDALPAWIPQTLGTTPADAWAPELVRAGGEWRLYYAASQFGTNNSVIALATTPTLDPDSPDHRWTDRGLVLRSHPGVDDYNAIDPDVLQVDAQTQLLSFGSFWSGIHARYLDPATGKPAGDGDFPLASRAGGPVEGPSIVRHGGYYYLFVAFDFCCRGVDSDYRVVVGRATSPTGPYVDRAGVPMLQGGGTEVLRGYNEFVGTGGADVWPAGGTDWFVNHYYDATDAGTPRLNVRQLRWSDGWPSLDDPVNPSREVGHGAAYVSIVARSAGGVAEDVGCGYEGADIALAAATGSPCQQWQVERKGSGARILNRSSNKVAEVAGCDNTDGGDVAQWGWLANDCQRWRPATSTDGWSTIASVLPGARVIDDAGCAAGAATGDLRISTARGDACQQFRFQPVGRVLLADVAGTAALGIPDCTSASPASGSPRLQARSTDACQEWSFSSAGGATYTVTNVATGLQLSTSRCTSSFPDRGKLRVVASDASHPECRRWTLAPADDGSWTLTDAGTSVAQHLSLRLP
ncbi:ricin-type beta-trefoil lectin protein [Motilibacter peucedani]|uniref:Ricin-type beta-trefoil lectin protein n=1 Tax=Motilibacter peucedani TaxID=598650 RepID=A0A420XQ82_9ACTN|nr:family 43 glycosylhydrolase [Motilibacter peucedani]RKS75443.1 ricin-type beta-trefoil lectin protein [Motilibacter peucedani]